MTQKQDITSLRRCCFRFVCAIFVCWRTWSGGSSVVIAEQNLQSVEVNNGSILAMTGRNCAVIAIVKGPGSSRAFVKSTRRSIIEFPNTIIGCIVPDSDIESISVELDKSIDNYSEVEYEYTRQQSGLYKRRDSLTLPSDKVSDFMGSIIRTQRSLDRRITESIVIGLKPEGWQDEWLEYDNGDSDTGTAETDITGLDERLQFLILLIKKVCTFYRRARYGPHIYSFDDRGKKTESDAFTCSGTGSEVLYALSNAHWKPNLSSDVLVNLCAAIFLAALGNLELPMLGITLYLLTEEGIHEVAISLLNGEEYNELHANRMNREVAGEIAGTKFFFGDIGVKSSSVVTGEVASEAQ